MNSFTYDYPVRNYFGEGAMDQALDAEMGAMGKTVMLAYGGGRLHSRRRWRVGLRLLQGGLRAGDA